MERGTYEDSKANERTDAAQLPELWLNRFQSPAQLGVGGMGIVWRAFDLRLQRWVAIKGVRSASRGTQRRLVREARLLARLQHPSLVQVYDLIWAHAPEGSKNRDRSWWIVMEFVEGETLSQRCRSGNRLEIKEVLELGIALAGGLAEVHAYGLVHRDLSSDNVILPRSGSPKLLDFGLAAVVNDGATRDLAPEPRRMAKPILGTPGFIAPELLSGIESDQRADLYGLGAVLYLAVAGRRLPAGEAPTQHQVGHWRGSRRRGAMNPNMKWLRPDIPPALSACIEGLLSQDPLERAQSAESVARELKAIKRALLPTSCDRLPTYPPQERSLLRAIGAIFVCGLLLAASLAWLLGCSEPPGLLPGMVTTEIDEVAQMPPFHYLATDTNPEPMEASR